LKKPQRKTRNLHKKEKNYSGDKISILTNFKVKGKKQEERNKLLEEELQYKNKTIQQNQSKLEEYAHAYPDFKPEKKKKP